MSVRHVGVEEELLLADPVTGELVAASGKAIRATPDAETAVEQELFPQQLETGTGIHTDLRELATDVRHARRVAGAAAAAAGAAVIAVPVPVLASEWDSPTPKDRYRRIMERFGAVGRAQLVCGMHLHVDVDSDDEAIGAFDRMRPWLPVLLALSGNSPFCQGEDTGYASWRAQVWKRWPTAGPTDAFGDAAGYRRVSDALLATGAALDEGMLYFDARPSRRYPTLELRVFDVCTDVADVVLLAGLGRALVDTCAVAWSAGEAVPEVRTDLLRAATWRASRYGIADRLVDPRTGVLTPARAAVAALLHHVSPALSRTGDDQLVPGLVEELFARGTGATRQRAIAEAAQGDLFRVVSDLRRRTEQSWESD